MAGRASPWSAGTGRRIAATSTAGKVEADESVAATTPPGAENSLQEAMNETAQVCLLTPLGIADSP